MTLIRKHERVDGKFDVEPKNHAEIIALFSNGEWHMGWYRKREYSEHFEPLNQSSVEWDRVTAYIDPSEEVAPVEVKEDREIGRGTFITYCDNCGQEHMVGRRCRDGGSHSCSEVYQ